MTKNIRKVRCGINFKHTLSELSVNRKDPCEVIRELISNSYDANASVIEIYPLLQYQGFIFIDNGIGISSEKEIRGFTPIDAFFSIGTSTKTAGDTVGHKCQGSKLCFASGKFALITRCKEDKESWRSVILDNPRDSLDPNKDNIEIEETFEPWLVLEDLLPQPDKRTVEIINYLNETYFKSNLSTGTLILVRELDVDDFSKYYNYDNTNNKQHSYIKTYIKFYTKHGDVRILDYARTGFKSIHDKNFKNSSSTYNDKCQLWIWSCSSQNGKLEKVSAGYPYIDKPDIIPGLENYTTYKSPAEIKKLNFGRFHYRNAHTFKFDGITYSLVLAIDGNRRALEFYEDLDRQGKKKSGISFSSQRGTFICSEGVKICPYNEIFDYSLLRDYKILSDSKAQTHYVLMINGSFQLVTNRNSLAEPGTKILRNEQFLSHIKDFLDRSQHDSKVFKQLMERLGNEVSESKTEAQVQQFDKQKSEIVQRDYFHILDVEILQGKKFLVPKLGEEHGVGALYTLLAHLVPKDSPYSKFWLRPLNFSCQGIDSLATQLNDDKLEKELKGLEYKHTFSTYDIFNHPLVVTDQILCWDFDESVSPSAVVDDGTFKGEIQISDKLKEIGCEIVNLVNEQGSCHNSNIQVIRLKDLIDKTFQCEWRKGYASLVSQPKTRKRSK